MFISKNLLGVMHRQFTVMTVITVITLQAVYIYASAHYTGLRSRMLCLIARHRTPAMCGTCVIKASPDSLRLQHACKLRL